MDKLMLLNEEPTSTEDDYFGATTGVVEDEQGMYSAKAHWLRAL